MPPEAFKVTGLPEMADATGEYKIARREAVFEEVQELASEQFRHDPYGNEEPLAARHPSVTVRRQATAGDNTVDMGVVHEVLPPGVQDAYYSCPRAEMAGIICKFHERFGCRTEKEVIHDLLVHGNQGIQ